MCYQKPNNNSPSIYKTSIQTSGTTPNIENPQNPKTPRQLPFASQPNVKPTKTPSIMSLMILYCKHINFQQNNQGPHFNFPHTCLHLSFHLDGPLVLALRRVLLMFFLHGGLHRYIGVPMKTLASRYNDKYGGRGTCWDLKCRLNASLRANSLLHPHGRPLARVPAHLNFLEGSCNSMCRFQSC